MKKILVTSLSLILAMGLVACGQKEDTQQNNTQQNNTAQNDTTQPNTTQNNTTGQVDYTEQYSYLYNDYLANLRNYSIYDDADNTVEYYKNNKYPGNEQYVQDLKDAYNDSKVNIQHYIDAIKNDVKTDDKELSQMNQNLVSQGEKTISNIDKKLQKLDTIPKDAYNKSQDEFIRLVHDTTDLEDNAESDFNDVLEDLNKRLNINTNTNTNNNMNNNNNTNNNMDQNKK